MSEHLVVRHAVPDDAAQVTPLLAALGYAPPVDDVRERLTRLAGSADDAVYVADRAGALVGVASVHRLPLLHATGYLARITALVVAAPCRRTGVGRALVEAVEDFAWRNGCARIEVTSGDHRPDAHAFYERHGYRVDERRFLKLRDRGS